MTFLPNDICRCTDVLCPFANKCARYVLREHGGVGTPYAMSLKRIDTTGHVRCDYFIQFGRPSVKPSHNGLDFL